MSYFEFNDVEPIKRLAQYEPIPAHGKSKRRLKKLDKFILRSLK